MPAPEGCALVTGASRGIGAATARALAEDGWSVAVNYRRNKEAAEDVVSAIAASGAEAFLAQGDVAEVDEVEQMFARIEKEHGPVLALVNNAGVRADDLTVSMSDDDWAEVLRTNLSGPFNTIRRAFSSMMRARFGRIINVTSTVARTAWPGQPNYAATKGGLEAMTRVVACEGGRRNITVNAVEPGYVVTDMTSDWAGQDDWLVRALPLNRAAGAEEIAACIRFLASAEAAYVTGATLVVDGGLSIVGPIPPRSGRTLRTVSANAE